MQVIQLTSVPPPTPVPARVMIAASHDTLNPWLRYSRSNAAELVGRHLGLRHERARLEDDDRPAGVREVRRHDAAARARAHDDDVRVEDEGFARGRPRGELAQVERPDRRRVGVTGSGTTSKPIVASRGLTPVSPGSA